MVMPVDYPATVGLLSAAGDLKMPFPDIVKYSILGISVILLLLSLGILAWQAYQCCAQRHARHTLQDTGERGLITISTAYMFIIRLVRKRNCKMQTFSFLQ